MNLAQQTMQAAVVVGAGRVELRDAPRPTAGPGMVRYRVEGCGVCASNLGPWAGPEWMEFPTAPGGLGHEAWGIIDAVGDGVDAQLIGTRVSALSFNAYAQYDIADANAVVPLSPLLGQRPVPGEPLGCAINIFERSGITASDTVAIVGIGFLGALLTQLAAGVGARVIAISRRPFALETAARMGASETIAMDDHWRVIEEVKSLTDSLLCDCVIEAVGKQWPLDLAAELTRERGRLVVAGYHQDGPRQVNMQMWNWRGIDVINAHERDPQRYVGGIRKAVDMIADGGLRPDSLYTHSYPLGQLAEALDATRDRPHGFMKALVHP